MKQISLRLPSDLDNQAFNQAQKESMSKNQLIKKAICYYLLYINELTEKSEKYTSQNKENVNC